jgi:hypothetical protein
MLGTLTDQQVNNLLTSQVRGRLACTDGKKPYIVPVNYSYDGKYIYGQTNEGKKLRILRKNPNVCFEVGVMTDNKNWQTVLLYGEFEELDGKKAAKAKESLYNSAFYLMTGSSIHSHQHEVSGKLDDSNREKAVMYRINIKKITGRFEKF